MAFPNIWETTTHSEGGQTSLVQLTYVMALHLSEDVVRRIGAGERYLYRRNPGLTLITFTNLKRPSSKLHKVKG